MNRIKAYSIILLLPINLAWGCNRQPADLSEDKKQEIIEQGNRISQKLAGTLMGQLTNEIKENGVVSAISYCSVVAIPLTDSISGIESAKVSRVSHKHRNPQNAANEEEIELINYYISQFENKTEFSPTIKASKQGYLYYSPIVIGMPTCLNCHGRPHEDIQPEVLAAIRKSYPNDNAIGFEMGQVRGLFKIEFDRDRFDE